MWHYDPPLRDMRFVVDEVLGAPDAWTAMSGFEDLDAGTAAQVLEQAGRFAAEVLAPINGPGDLEGCVLADGRVSTPRGFREAYQAFCEGGVGMGKRAGASIRRGPWVSQTANWCPWYRVAQP